MSVRSPISFGNVFLGLIAFVGVFIVALAWNEAIISSINRGAIEKSGNFGNDLLTGKYIYAIVATIILLLIVWWLQSSATKNYNMWKHPQQYVSNMTGV